MVLSRLAKKLGDTRRAPPSAPPGLRIYAIGDVHGRLDLLDRLSAKIAADLSRATYDRTLAIFLGDLIDRGPDSAGVVGRLESANFPTPIVALRGNHEELLLNFLKDATVLESWRRFGALETLHSYGVDIGAAARGARFEETRRELAAKLPLAHLRFLERTQLTEERGGYFFVHAGVKPQVPLDAQRRDDLLWIREEFLRFEGDYGKFIVHGHTPTPEPEVRGNRINIDTGAFATSVLTALVLEGQEQRFLDTR